MTALKTDRESISDAANPLGLDGIGVHRIPDRQAVSTRPGAGDDGLCADCTAPLA